MAPVLSINSFDTINDIGTIVNDSSANSDDTHAENVTVLAVQQLENFYSCINCKKSVKPNVKAACETVQKLLSPNLSARLMIEHNNDIVTVKAFMMFF